MGYFMRRAIIRRQGIPSGPPRPGGGASDSQVQEFVRLYLEVEPKGRRILERLVRQWSARPHPPHALH